MWKIFKSTVNIIVNPLKKACSFLGGFIAMGTIKLIYMLSAVVSVGLGIYLAVAFPSIPVLGKFSSVIFASCGCFIGGVILGKLSIINKQHIEKEAAEKKSVASDELQDAKKRMKELESLYEKEIEQIKENAEREIEKIQLLNREKDKDIQKLQERVDNLANSVICSFQFFAGKKFNLGTAKYTVQKYMHHLLNNGEPFPAVKFHRAYHLQYREVFSEKIKQRWDVELDKLRFRISNESKIEIFNADPVIDFSSDDEKSLMKGKVFKLKYNDKDKAKNSDSPEEIIWEKGLDVSQYEADIDKFRKEEIENLEKPFKNSNGDDELTKSLKNFVKNELKEIFDKIFTMAGNFYCEIKEGSAPNDAIDLNALTKEINALRLQHLLGMTKKEAQERLSLANNQKK